MTLPRHNNKELNMSFMHKVKIDGCKVKWIGNANQYNKQSILLSISAPRDFKNKDPKDHIFYSMFVSIDCSKHQIPSLGDKVSVELFPMIKERKDKDGNPAIDHNGYSLLMAMNHCCSYPKSKNF